MTQKDEIKALREEVARLRERVAVLEARPQYTPEPRFIPQESPYRVVPMTPDPVRPWYVGDTPGWWLQTPTAIHS